MINVILLILLALVSKPKDIKPKIGDMVKFYYPDEYLHISSMCKNYGKIVNITTTSSVSTSTIEVECIHEQQLFKTFIILSDKNIYNILDG